MAHVYTMEGTRKPRRKRKRKGKGLSGAQRAQNKRFGAASKKCKGRPGSAFRSCMSKELSR